MRFRVLGIGVVVISVGALGGAAVVSGANPFATTAPATISAASDLPDQQPSTTTTLLPTTTTSTLPPVALPPVPAGMARGASGPEVQAYEQRLIDLKYDPGKLDGVFDGPMLYAVQAFQKIHGLDRSGQITEEMRIKLEQGAFPEPLAPSGTPTRAEIDLMRQVLILYKDGALRLITTISTGNGRRYCVDGQCSRAITPGGDFAFTWRWNGWRTSRLGKLYNPVYFNGGIAIHGSMSVPPQPASHGCVRIPMHIAQYFPRLVNQGDAVHVLFGDTAPVPFNEQAPAEIIRTTKPTTATTAPVPTTLPTQTTLPTPTTTPTSSTTPTTGPTTPPTTIS